MAMTLEEFSAQFADAIEIPHGDVSGTTEFKQLDIWDSLCVLTIFAMIDTNFNVTVGGNDLEKAVSVADLFELVRSRTK
jgi:acyl carrier protein